MKRFYTIGRDSQCDIVISDDSDVTSRQHAILEVGKNGKYFLTDKSRNGTYVNGIKMSAGERIPLKRNDSVSFSHVSELNWNLVPKDYTLRNTLLIVLAVLIVLAGVGVAIWQFTSKDKDAELIDNAIENISVGTDVNEKPSDASKEQEIIEAIPEKKENKTIKTEKKKSKAEKKEETEPGETVEKEEIINPIY